jgi:hypothetical protein
LKYYFLNYLVFEDINTSYPEEYILDTFKNIAFLIRDLNTLDSELILDSKISEFHFREKKLHYYFRLLLDNEDSDAVRLLLARIQKELPFCSDNFDEYYDNEDIVLGDCTVENTEISILENCLACALFLNTSIITPRMICENSYFLNETIKIKCGTNLKELENLFLEDNEHIIEQITKTIKYNTDNWNDWEQTILPSYQNINISTDCFNEMNIYSFSSDIAKSILRFIESINIFIEGKIVANENYEECCSNTHLESDTRLKKLKAKFKVYNCKHNSDISSWHTYIKKDFRLYFTLDKDNNKICFVKFTKKIT